MKPYRIGVDVDGVLADFDEAWVKFIAKHTGKNIHVGPEGPSRWDWDLAGGLTKAEEVMLWKRVQTNPTFWETLRPLPKATLALDQMNLFVVNGSLEVYFITSRPGNTAKLQTERWLNRWGMSYPTVLLADNAKHKGEFAKQLQLDAFIDDKPENVHAVKDARKETTVYVADAIYNRATAGDYRATDVAHFMSKITKVLVERSK